MTIFNLETCKFEIYKKQEKFLAIQIDQQREDLAEVIHIFVKCAGIDGVLALNNENDIDLEQSLELFSSEDVRFLFFLDYYRLDNIDEIKRILRND